MLGKLKEPEWWRALHTENNSGKTMDIIFPIVKGVDITEDHAYLLYVFITDFQPL